MPQEPGWMQKALQRTGSSLQGARLRLSMPFVSYELDVNDLLDRKTADERIAKLGAVQRDLEAAVSAVGELRTEAEARQTEAEALRKAVAALREEAGAAQAMLSLSHEALERLLAKAGSKGRMRGVFEGVVIGFITGLLSSVVASLIMR